MNLAMSAVDRSLERRRARYEGEVDALISGALRLLRRKGCAAATVADLLSEAGLSTRAFYRHFRSKEELFLAVFERDSAASGRRMEGRLAGLTGARAQLEGWIDEVLSLGYNPARARRTRLFAHEAEGLRGAYPTEFRAIRQPIHAPLVQVLEAGRRTGSFPLARPENDARSIHALTWSLVGERLEGGGPPDAASARDQVLRFCLPALGASSEPAVGQPGARVINDA